MGLADRLRQKPPPPGPELDRLMVAQLRGRKANLALPRHVLHFLHFQDEQSARDAAGAVEQAGYEATVSSPPEPEAPWTVRAEASRVVDETTVDSYRAVFERIAREHAGEYDGWEAAAKP